MKKIHIILLLLSMLVISCQNDGGTSSVDLGDGIVPSVSKSPSAEAFIDLFKIQDGDPISLVFNVDIGEGVANIVSTDIIGSYASAAGPVYNSTLFSDVTLPQDFTLTGDDIIASFSELNSNDDILLGDILTISTRFTLDDGTILNIINEDGTINHGTNLATRSAFTTVVSYPVTCPSDLGGTYLVFSTAVGCCGVSPITDYQYTVTVTDNGGGSYALSDFSGGMYDGLFCGPFGICGDASGGNITDICNDISGSAPDCCGSTIEFKGTVDPDTGNWDVEISSGFLAGTSVWVKQ